MIRKEYLYGIIAIANVFSAAAIAMLYAFKTVEIFRYFISVYFSPETWFGIVANIWSKVIMLSILVLFVAGWYYKEPFLIHPWKSIEDMYYKITGSIKSQAHKRRHDKFLDAVNHAKKSPSAAVATPPTGEYDYDIRLIIKGYSDQKKAWTVPEVMKALEARRFIPPHQKHQVVQQIRDFRRFKTFHI